ncbi:MAG: SDR family oxidoreductase [Pseudomonadota bacterium]
MKLEGKAAVITGAGRGLGRAMALVMSREGARIAIMSRSREELEYTAKQIKNAGQECLIFPGDVSSESDVTGMVTESREVFSKIDILVNNAAIIGPTRFTEDANFTAWKRTMDINLNGAFLCTRAVVPIMIAAGGGKILNISSGLGQMPFPRFCAYAVSKAGMIQLTRSLSEELKEMNIQVNAIDPGVMDTHMQEEIRAQGPEILGESVYRNFLEYKKKGHLKDPAVVASLAVFLVSDEADRISGYFGTLDDYTKLGWRP